MVIVFPGRRVAAACAVLFWTLAAASAQSDALSWVSTGGPSAGHIDDIAVGPDGRLYAVAGSAGLFQSMDSGDMWSSVGGPVGAGALTQVALSRGYVFVADERHLYRSSDLDTWSLVPLPYLPTRRFAPIALRGDGGALHITVRLRYSRKHMPVLRSTDAGETWRRLNPSIPAAKRPNIGLAAGRLFVVAGEDLYARDEERQVWLRAYADELPAEISILHSDGPYVYVGTVAGHVYRIDPVADRCEPLTPTPLAGVIGKLATLDGDVYASVGASVYRVGAGVTAVDTSDGLPGHRINALLGTPAGLFAGASYAGLYRSRDGGRWEMSAAGIEAARNRQLVSHEGSIYLNAAHTIYRFDAAAESWLRNLGELRSTAIDALASTGSALVANTSRTGRQTAGQRGRRGR